ncbi:MAG: acyl carrier protein [Chitinophagaceae bacterium]|nr:acyl carrier protein [Chitinophagaceae bacterium]
MNITIDDILPIFKDIFENDRLEITEKTTAADIEEWDSINHIYLIVAIEKKFKKKFTTTQIQNWKTVGDILKDLNS